MEKNILQNQLRVQRAIKDVTQEEVAAAVGVTRKTINTVKSGKYVPSTVLAIRLARYFGIPVEELFVLDE